MKSTDIRSVQEMIEALTPYPNNRVIALFNADNCPMSIQSEKQEKDGKLCTWITLGTEAKTKVRTVGELVTLLKQCPPQMVLTMRGQDKQFSSLYLAEEGVKNSYNQWLVICDKRAYETYYQKKQESITSTVKQRSLDKVEWQPFF